MIIDFICLNNFPKNVLSQSHSTRDYVQLHGFGGLMRAKSVICSLHAFWILIQIQFFQVRFSHSVLWDLFKGPTAKWRRNATGKKWTNGVTSKFCGPSRRSLRRVPAHLYDLVHCAAEERWIVFSSMGEQYVIVSLLCQRSCRLLSVPSPKRLRRRCTAKSLPANYLFLEV